MGWDRLGCKCRPVCHGRLRTSAIARVCLCACPTVPDWSSPMYRYLRNHTSSCSSRPRTRPHTSQSHTCTSTDDIFRRHARVQTSSVCTASPVRKKPVVSTKVSVRVEKSSTGILSTTCRPCHPHLSRPRSVRHQSKSVLPVTNPL